jgi:hypothetical protein
MKSSLTIVFATLLVSVVILAATSAFGDKCIKCYVKGGNGGDGGSGGGAVIFGSKNSINRNTTDIVNTTETG